MCDGSDLPLQRGASVGIRGGRDVTGKGLAVKVMAMFDFGCIKPFLIQLSVIKVIKVELKARGGEFEKCVPGRRWQVGVVEGGVVNSVGCDGDGGKPIIKDNVKLRRNGDCGDVEDKWDAGGMRPTESHEDTATGAWLPTWNFLTVLETWIQNVSWTAPNVKVDELLSGNTSASNDVNWGNAGLAIGAVIVDVDGVVDGHGPMG